MDGGALTKLVPPKEASGYYGVSEQTLRVWARKGKIAFEETLGGHRRYRIPIENHNRVGIIYSRVSSRKQKADLKRQSNSLRKLYPTYRLVEDIGSGINVKRKGFRTILELLFRGRIKAVVVAYPDRFTRFSFDLFEWMFQFFGSQLVALKTVSGKSEEQELAEDLLAITTVFSSRYYGRRASSVFSQD